MVSPRRLMAVLFVSVSLLFPSLLTVCEQFIFFSSIFHHHHQQQHFHLFLLQPAFPEFTTLKKSSTTKLTVKIDNPPHFSSTLLSFLNVFSLHFILSKMHKMHIKIEHQTTVKYWIK